MDFQWSGFLLLLVLIPLLIALYVWMLRRRRRFTVRYSSLSLVRDALPRKSNWRRHLPFALFLCGLASLTVAAGRPVSVVSVPTDQTTIILTVDVSRSMCSNDILPSRLEAAEAAMLSFIQQQGGQTQIAIVAFSGFAELVQAPTTDPELLQSAVESLLTGRRTAIGSGILKSIEIIAEVDPNVAPLAARTLTGLEPMPVPAGAYVPAIIVLLTDGASNSGPMPLVAAQQAADRGIRVYTIGFGTERGGAFPNCGRQFMGREPGDGGTVGGNAGQFGGGGGGSFRRGIDEDTLKAVADATGGAYYSAESAGELQNVFRDLPTYLIAKSEVTEISVAFVALGALLAGLAITLAQLWHPLT